MPPGGPLKPQLNLVTLCNLEHTVVKFSRNLKQKNNNLIIFIKKGSKNLREGRLSGVRLKGPP